MTIKSICMNRYEITLEQSGKQYSVVQTWGPGEINSYNFKDLGLAMTFFDQQYEKFLNTYEN